MKRSGPILWRHAPSAVYRDAVDLRLVAAFGRSAEKLHVSTAVGAAHEFGMTPVECIAWLARIDGL